MSLGSTTSASGTTGWHGRPQLMQAISPSSSRQRPPQRAQRVIEVAPCSSRRALAEPARVTSGPVSACPASRTRVTGASPPRDARRALRHQRLAPPDNLPYGSSSVCFPSLVCYSQIADSTTTLRVSSCPIDVGVFFGERVTLCAMGLSCIYCTPTLTTQDVHSLSYGLKVIRPDAVAHTAEVIPDQPIRCAALEVCMRHNECRACPEPSVSPYLRRRPKPAITEMGCVYRNRARLIDLCVKPLLNTRPHTGNPMRRSTLRRTGRKCSDRR